MHKQSYWMLNVFGQFIFVSFTILTFWIGFTLTLPEYCQHDRDCVYQSKLLAWYFLLNMLVNYVCIGYRGKLSVVTDELLKAKDKAKSLLLNTPPNVGMYSSSFVMPRPEFHSSHSSLRTPHSQATRNSANINSYESYFSNERTHSITEGSFFTYTQNGHSISSHGISSYSFPSSPAPLIAGWVSCGDCNLSVPPRARHCPLCKFCVLKRDHHCFFAGCCIGFHNQAHFVVFCLHCALGALYSLVVLSSYLNQHYHNLQTWGYLAYLLPVLFMTWIYGGVSTSTAGLVLFFLWSIFICIICCFYFLTQLVLVCRGQTTYEWLKGIKTYRGTCWKNIQSVFGIFWPLNFIIPIPFWGFVDDGISWDHMTSNPKLF